MAGSRTSGARHRLRARDPRERWQGLIYHRYHFQNRDEPSIKERAAGVALLCRQLRESGVRPDLVLAHSAWGEALQLRRIWGSSMPIVVYPELWGHDPGPFSVSMTP